MSDPIDGGGPAFPQPIDDMGTFRAVTEGMSMRDYFAAKAMHAIMQRYEADTKLGPYAAYKNLARGAYSIADAMLAERNKQP